MIHENLPVWDDIKKTAPNPLAFLSRTSADFRPDTQAASPCILAPMAGVSDLPFRMINRYEGCGFAFIPMLSAKALIHHNEKTEKMLSTIPSDRPLGIQLLGNDEEVLRQALEILQRYRFDLIDFNAGCPVKKVVRRGEGAYLLKDPAKLNRLLKTLVAHAGAPVSVKIRTGWDQTSVNARDIALSAQDAGINLLWIHGRTRMQGYGEGIDYKTIKEVKNALEIPVVGSGDAFNPRLIKKMIDETGCDFVGIARGALGNPWLFKETEDFLNNSSTIDPGIETKTRTIFRHLNMCCDFHGEKNGVLTFRKYFAWYTKGFKNIKPLRTAAFLATTKAGMTDIIWKLATEGLK